MSTKVRFTNKLIFASSFQSDKHRRTGIIRWDQFGERTDFEIIIKQLKNDGPIEVVGTWRPNQGLLWKNLPRDGSIFESLSAEFINNKIAKAPLRITTVLVKHKRMHKSWKTFYFHLTFPDTVILFCRGNLRCLFKRIYF